MSREKIAAHTDKTKVMDSLQLFRTFMEAMYLQIMALELINMMVCVNRTMVACWRTSVKA
jgi:cytochrome c biogenesis protein ResB